MRLVTGLWILYSAVGGIVLHGEAILTHVIEEQPIGVSVLNFTAQPEDQYQ